MVVSCQVQLHRWNYAAPASAQQRQLAAMPAPGGTSNHQRSLRHRHEDNEPGIEVGNDAASSIIVHGTAEASVNGVMEGDDGSEVGGLEIATGEIRAAKVHVWLLSGWVSRRGC